ncbi:hypothetical protein GCM10009853_069770 [Glycomyces scopariae]
MEEGDQGRPGEVEGFGGVGDQRTENGAAREGGPVTGSAYAGSRFHVQA